MKTVIELRRIAKVYITHGYKCYNNVVLSDEFMNRSTYPTVTAACVGAVVNVLKQSKS